MQLDIHWRTTEDNSVSFQACYSRGKLRIARAKFFEERRVIFEILSSFVVFVFSMYYNN